METPNSVRRVAVIGAGTIGASWAAYFLSRGLEVSVQDPSAAREDAVHGMIREAWPILEKLGMAPGADPDRWRFTTDPREAARGADFVQESAPERNDVKIELYGMLEEVLADDAIISSSTSGLLMSELQQGRRAPGRFVVGHPFNPPHRGAPTRYLRPASTAPASDRRARGRSPTHSASSKHARAAGRSR